MNCVAQRLRFALSFAGETIKMRRGLLEDVVVKAQTLYDHFLPAKDPKVVKHGQQGLCCYHGVTRRRGKGLDNFCLVSIALHRSRYRESLPRH